MSTVNKIAFLRSAYARKWVDEFDVIMQLWCESPIEQLFIGQMLLDGWWYPPGYELWSLRNNLPNLYGIDCTSRILQIDDMDGYAIAQPKVSPEGKQYRLDLAFVSPQGRIAVELDGHDFHEKTKEQARKDKSRDRALTKAGWRVLRFAGSEVYADPSGCIMQVREMSQALQREAYPAASDPSAVVQ